MLAPVMEIPTLAMFHPREDLPFRRAVALEFIGNAHPWHILQPFEQRAKKLLCGLLVAAALPQDVEDVIVLVNRSPQIMPLAIDGQEHLISVPLVPRPWSATPQLNGITLPELAAPLADRFVGHSDPAFHADLVHITVAQSEAVGEPDPMTDDFAGKAVVLVSFGVSGWVIAAVYPGVQ